MLPEDRLRPSYDWEYDIEPPSDQTISKLSITSAPMLVMTPSILTAVPNSIFVG